MAVLVDGSGNALVDGDGNALVDGGGIVIAAGALSISGLSAILTKVGITIKVHLRRKKI